MDRMLVSESERRLLQLAEVRVVEAGVLPIRKDLGHGRLRKGG